jgi:hypothetical protein
MVVAGQMVCQELGFDITFHTPNFSTLVSLAHANKNLQVTSQHLIRLHVEAVVQQTIPSFATSSFQDMLFNTKSLIIGSNALSIMHAVPAHMMLSMSTLHISAPRESKISWHIWLGSVGLNRSQPMKSIKQHMPFTHGHIQYCYRRMTKSTSPMCAA